MDIKNKKALAYVLIIIGIIALGFMVKTIIDRPEKLEEEITNIEKEEETESLPEEGESVENKEKEEINIEEPSDNATTFDNIISILKYDVHPEIEELLNVKKFDSELTAFLLEKKAITDASHETPSGIILCTSSDYLTKDLQRNVYLFDLKLDNENKSIVSVSVSGEGYSFDIR